MQRKVYLVEAVLMSFLLGIVEGGTPAQAQSMVHQVLDLLWLFMEVRLLTSGQDVRLHGDRGGKGRVLEGAAHTAIPGPACSRSVCSLASLFQDYEVQDCLKQSMMSLLRLYRFSPIVPDLGLQVGAPTPTLSPLGLACRL